MDNPFADWNPNDGQQTKVKTKTQLELQQFYFKSRKKVSELQEIQSFNNKFQEFTIETNEQSEQQKYFNSKINEQMFYYFENKNLLNEDQVSFKSLGELQTVLAFGSHLAAILVLLYSQGMFGVKVTAVIIQTFLLLLFGLHLRYFGKIWEKIKRSQCLKTQMIFLGVGEATSIWVCFGQTILVIFILVLCGFDVWRGKKLVKLYILQLMIQKKLEPKPSKVEQFEDFDFQ